MSASTSTDSKIQSTLRLSVMLYNNTLFVPQILERSRRSAADVALVDFDIFSRQPNDKTVQAALAGEPAICYVTPGEERLRSTGKTAFRFQISTPFFAFGQMPPLDAYVRCCGGLNSEGRQGTLLFGPFLLKPSGPASSQRSSPADCAAKCRGKYASSFCGLRSTFEPF